MIKLFRIYLIKKSKMLEIPVSAMHLFLYLNNILKVRRQNVKKLLQKSKTAGC